MPTWCVVQRLLALSRLPPVFELSLPMALHEETDIDFGVEDELAMSWVEFGAVVVAEMRSDCRLLMMRHPDVTAQYQTDVGGKYSKRLFDAVETFGAAA